MEGLGADRELEVLAWQILEVQMDYMVSCGRGASASASWCSAIKSLKGSAAFKIS